ncbi:MAG: RNA polymerase sigma factor [Candidatus Aminicenantales bacterium]
MRTRSSGDDREVISALMDQYEKIFRFCLGFSKNPGEAEELMQETYLRAWRKLASLQNPNHSREWLFKIARNTCLNHLRKRRMEKLLALKLKPQISDENSPEHQTLHKEEQQIFKTAVNRLPKKQRDVFILKEYSELSYQEIAKTLGIKEGTVMSRLSRARAAVIQRLRKESHGS